MSVDSTELVVRPSRRSRRTALAGTAAIMLLIVGAGAVASGPDTVWVATLLAVVIGLPIAASVLVHHRRAEVAVTSTEIVVSGLFKRQRCLRSDAARIVHAMIIAPRTPVYGNLFILDHHGNRLARIYTTYYRDDDLRRVVARLGLPVSALGHPVTANQLAGWYPGIVWFGERRPFTFAVIISVSFLLALIAVLAITL